MRKISSTRERPTPNPETTPMPIANAVTTSSRPITPENTPTPHAAPTALPTLTSETTTMHAAHAVPIAPSSTTLCLALDRGAASNDTTPPRRVHERPEELALLRASQVDNVAAEEIEFLFTTDDVDAEVASARAIIASRLAELDPRDHDALALYYEPEPWPASILEEGLNYERGYALVLANAAASSWRPTGRRSFVHEQAASEQLRAAIYDHGPRALRHLTRRAEWDFATALRAYAKARGRAPSALVGRSVKGGVA